MAWSTWLDVLRGREPEPEVIRVDGDADCPHCYAPYRNHPLDLRRKSAIDGRPYLRIGCDGKRLKL